MNQIDLVLPDPQTADALASHGMSRSTAHAESLSDGFTEAAYGVLKRFCALQGHIPFTSEEFRLYAVSVGFEIPVPKALGTVFKRAARDKLIVRDGFGKSFSRHGSPCPRWRAGGYHINRA